MSSLLAQPIPKFLDSENTEVNQDMQAKE